MKEEYSLKAKYGHLLFQDKPFQNRKTYTHISLLIHFAFLMMIAGLLWVLLVKNDGNPSLINWGILIVVIFIIVIIDIKAQYDLRIPSYPMKIYEKGISMPTTFMERAVLGKTNFILAENINILVVQKVGPYSWVIKWPHKEKGPQYLYKIIVLTRNKKKYQSFERYPDEVNKFIEVIRKRWPDINIERENDL
jgi:hypothetical protein